MFDAILQEIKNHETIIIHRHKNPDGDALGSQIGMKHLILENFPEKRVYMVGDAPRFYGFMEGSQMDEIPDSAYEGALAIILDCGSAHLISDERYTLAARTVRMDHHLFTGKFADTEAIDTSFESCCGLITQLAESCGLRLNVPAAKALYTGMVTDSGRFRYDATTSRTFHLASLLLQQPFDITDIYRELYADEYESKKLKAQFILKIQFTPKNVANFTETDKGVLCELRSSRYNINPIAVKYGGGGHAKASGATLPDRETAMAMLADLDAMTGENE